MKFLFPVRHVMVFRRAVLGLLFSAGSLALMAGSSPECARVDDASLNPVSSTLPEAVATACAQECAAAAVEARQAERLRFVQAIKACPDGECRQEEAGLHVQIMQEISQDQLACQSSCHQQGGGSGGN